jgi:glutathione S-transferase
LALVWAAEATENGPFDQTALVIRLYRAPFSTNVERVALALAHKGLEAESVVIDYSDRSAVEEVSGQPLVPVVDFGGEVVFDSWRILRRLDELHPDPPLIPASLRGQVAVFAEWFNEIWKSPPNEIERVLGLPETDPDEIARLAGRMDAWLDVFDAMLDGRDHLLADDFTAADALAYPFLKYAAGRDPADSELFHEILDKYQSVEGRPRLAAWIQRVSERPQA